MILLTNKCVILVVYKFVHYGSVRNILKMKITEGETFYTFKRKMTGAENLAYIDKKSEKGRKI